MDSYFIPDINELSNEAMVQWYGNVLHELEDDFLSNTDKDYVREYYREAGLLQWWRYPFFRRHFVESFTDAANYLLSGTGDGVFVDLGCGTGTQSLILAMGGAKVIGVDMDGLALEIFRKRQTFYEEKLGRSLDIELLEGNVFDMDFSSLGPVRGVYSMFAFNMMQPSDKLLDRVSDQMTLGSRFVVIDGNCQSLFARIWPGRQRNVWSPAQFAAELQARTIKVASLKGGVAVPPQLWRLMPYGLMAGLDNMLCQNLFLPVSHQVMGEKFDG